jgi:hypothetical protein
MRSTIALMSALAIVAVGAVIAVGSDSIAVDGPTTIDQVLARWEKEAAGRKTVAVTFTREDKLKGWDSENYDGRLIIKDRETAVLHRAKTGKVPKDFERILWTRSEVRQYDYSTKEIFCFSTADVRGFRLPDLMCIPFLFNRTVAEIKENYDFHLQEENDKSYVIRFSPRYGAGSAPVFVEHPKGNFFQRMFTGMIFSQFAFSRAYLELDKETLLPRRFLLVAPNRKDTQDYKVTNIRCNEPVPEELFRAVQVKGWTLRGDPTPAKAEPAKP